MADIVCGVDFVIGSGRVKIREFLRLGPHSIVRLDEAAGADLELRVNGVVLAQGEVAVMDDSAALRITRIAVPAGVGWD
jgi:flagellar motor switch protein FliN/FliY